MTDYKEGRVYGTDVIGALRKRGFNGLSFVRSASDAGKDYAEIGTITAPSLHHH